MIKKVLCIISVEFFYMSFKLDFDHFAKLRYYVTTSDFILSKKSHVTLVQSLMNNINHHISDILGVWAGPQISI